MRDSKNTVKCKCKKDELEKQEHVADKVEDDTGVVSGVCAQDRHADGEEGLMEGHDDQDNKDHQDDHNDQDD